MKKLISILAIILALTTGAFAQEAKTTTSLTEDTLTLVNQIDATVNLSPQMKNDFITLLNMKADALANAQNEEDKKMLTERFNIKLMGGLTEEQKNALTANKELYQRFAPNK